MFQSSRLLFVVRPKLLNCGVRQVGQSCQQQKIGPVEAAHGFPVAAVVLVAVFEGRGIESLAVLRFIAPYRGGKALVSILVSGRLWN